MTLIQAYNDALTKLKNPQTEEINIRILLCENNGLSEMSSFFICQNENIKDLQRFNRDLQRYLSGEPVQYIVKNCEFYKLRFVVTPDVLIPRNETEEVVKFVIDEIKKIFGDTPINIADICCGSGCIGCAIFKHANIKKVYFSDISPEALKIAMKNANMNGVNAEFFEVDSFNFIERCELVPDVVISNPPYIIKKEDVDQSVLDYEPHLALFADESLSIYRKILEKATRYKIKLIVFEIGYDLEEKLREICNQYTEDYEYEFKKDMNGLLRILSLKLKQ